jgi:branched chain amino acid efflux pump
MVTLTPSSTAAPAVEEAPAPVAAGLLDRRAMAGGARAMAPWLVGFGLYGLVVGMAAGRAGIPALAGWLTGPALFSGGAQVATIDLLDAGAAPAVVVATAVAVNCRLAVYSAAMGARWRDTPRWWRALAAAVLVDPTFAVGDDRYRKGGDPAAAHAHYLGAALALAATWLAAMAAGILAAGRIPEGLALEFVIPLFLAAEIARKPGTPATRRAWVVTAVVAVVAADVPGHLGLLTAIAAGTAAALAVREDRP